MFMSLKFHQNLRNMSWRSCKGVLVQFFVFLRIVVDLCGPVSPQMVFFLVLDILWFIVSVAGVIFTLFLWLLYHFFVSSSVTEENCFMKDADTCYCKREGKADVQFESKLACVADEVR